MARKTVTALAALLPFPVAFAAWRIAQGDPEPTGMSWLAFGEGQDSALPILGAFASLATAAPYLIAATVASIAMASLAWSLPTDRKVSPSTDRDANPRP